MRNGFLISTALASLVVVAPAFAQVAEDPQNADDGIAEIVVTAQKKEESLQKVAIAVNAVTGDDLVQAGVGNAVDLTKQVPSVSLPNAGGTTLSIFLRGVGNINTSHYNDPAVIINYDGVALGRASGAFGAAFFDLQRVEVLKGPQGILYGRNATGGTINVIPARPILGERSGGFNLGYGNYDAINTDAHVNLPIGDNVAARFAASYAKRDGYNRDGSNDDERGALRGQLLFEPSKDLSIRIGADYSHVGGLGGGASYLGRFTPNGTGGYTYTPGPFDASEGLNTPAANAYRQTLLAAPGFGFLNSLAGPQSRDTTYWGINAELNWTTGLGKLTVIPAYRKSKDFTVFNGPAFNNATGDSEFKQFSLETRLDGSVGMVDYILGGYYFNENIDANEEYNQEFVLPIVDYVHKTESWAAFAHLTAHVSDRFRLVGGARYTHDDKSIDGFQYQFITFCGGTPPNNVVPPASFAQGCAAPGVLPHFPSFLNPTDTFNWLLSNGYIPAGSTLTSATQVFPTATAGVQNNVGSILKSVLPNVRNGTFSKVTWKVSAEFDISPANLIYAKVETGYHAGGFQMADGRERYEPEFITAYSIGSKNRFFGNRLQLNAEAFYWKYKDQQITYFTVDPRGVLINSNENAGSGTVKGFDIDMIAKPMSNTTLSGQVQYLKTSYDELHFITAAPRDNFGCPFTFTGRLAGGQPEKDINCSGNSFLFSPKWTVNLGIEQIIPLSNSLELVGGINTAWRDKQWGGFEHLAFQRIPAYWTTDLNLTLRDIDKGWSVSGYVRNLEGDRYNVAPYAAPVGFAMGNFTPPRTYGIRLSAEF